MTHSRVRGVVWIAATVMAFGGGEARGQSPGVTTTVVGGWSMDRDSIGPGLDNPTVLEPGWMAGLQADFYPGGGALGIRLAGFVSPRKLDSDAAPQYELVTANVGLTFRLQPVESLGAMIPYVALTVGGTRFKSQDGAPAFGGGDFGEDPVYRFHSTAALGLDIPLIHPLALRVEGGDRIIFPSIGDSPEVDGFPAVHTPVILVGLQTRFAMPARRRPVRRPPPMRETRAAVAEPEPEQPERAQQVRDTVPAEVPEPVAEQPVPVPAAAGAPAFTVEIESFLGRSTARRWAARAESEGLPAWYVDLDLAGTPASRLRIGATATEEEALRLAGVVEQELGWTVTVQRISSGEAVPTSAVERTRDFLAER